MHRISIWRLFAVSSLVLTMARPACASEAEMADLLEKVVDHYSRANASAQAYVGVLVQVTDATSAARVASQMDSAATQFSEAAEALFVVLSESVKYVNTPAPASGEYQQRFQAAGARQSALIQDWIEVSRQLGQEVERIDQLRDLPLEFWNVMRAQSVRHVFWANKLMSLSGRGVPNEVTKYAEEKLDLLDRHGPPKVVDIAIEGITSPALSQTKQQLAEALGPNLTVLVLEGNTGRGSVFTIAPVENFSKAIAALDFGTVIEQDEGKRMVKIKLHAPAATDTGPDWPELEQPRPEVAGLYQRGDLHWPTKEEIIRRYGRQRIVHVEVVNESDLPLKNQLSQVIRSAAPDAEFIRCRGGRAYLGPVNDFASFCRALDIGKVLERNERDKVLRLQADPQTFLVKADGVRIELLNSDDISAHSKEIRKQAKLRPSASPQAHFDFLERDNPRMNLDTLIKLAMSPAKYSSLVGGQDSIEMAPVEDFEAFVAKLDFLSIVQMDKQKRILKVEAKLDQLTGDAVAKRVGADSRLDPSDLNRLGIEAASPLRKISAIDGSRSSVGLESDHSAMAPVRTPADKYARLADLLQTGNPFERRDAIDQLLEISPALITDREVRKQIARNFRELATNHGNPDDLGKAVRGLAIYGGKYSVPFFVQILEEEELQVNPEVFEALARLKDPEGASAAAKMLGNFFNHKQAVVCLRNMGPVAENALIEVAPSDNPQVSLAAVELLGEVGTAKSQPLLRKAASSGNPTVREAAKTSLKKIRDRQQAVAP